jgi:hypothetical protein
VKTDTLIPDNCNATNNESFLIAHFFAVGYGIKIESLDR